MISPKRIAALLFVLPLLAAPAAAQADPAAVARARADSVRNPWTEADARFMTGMIPHHAQAIRMAKWAAPSGASAEIQSLAARIINAQQDEILVMQNWLRDRNQPVPEPDPAGMKMVMDGEEHHHLMPGMLTPEQMKQLEAARGEDFDRLFLQLMIQHHKGAVAMVAELFSHDGAGLDNTAFKLASDINVDQTTEIARMQRLLAARLFGKTGS
jgi:uncharacterized protein (DUF305 family)